MRRGTLFLVCVAAFAGSAVGTWRWASDRRAGPASAVTDESEPRPQDDRAVAASDPPIPAATPSAPTASAPGGGSGSSDDQKTGDGIPFTSSLFLSNPTAAVSLRNGIGRAIRDVKARSRACFAPPPSENIRLEYRFWVQAKRDRVILSRLSVREGRGRELSPEVWACLDRAVAGTHEATAAQLFSPAMQEKYAASDFFLEASFEDREAMTIFAARPGTESRQSPVGVNGQSFR